MQNRFHLDGGSRAVGTLTLLLILVMTGVSLSQPSKQPRSSSPFFRIHGAPGTAVTMAPAEEFELLYEDRYFYVDNNGLRRIHAVLNGLRFKLTVDPQEVRQGANTYLIPLRGELTIDLFRYMKRDGNRMSVTGEGPPGADAFIIVADQLVTDSVTYVLALESVPQNIALFQNFPNPFNSSTTIEYDIPDFLLEGRVVRLAIYNLLGKRVRQLVDERRFPGRFTVRWDGTNDEGEPVTSGVYLVRITSGKLQQARKLMLVK